MLSLFAFANAETSYNADDLRLYHPDGGNWEDSDDYRSNDYTAGPQEYEYGEEQHAYGEETFVSQEYEEEYDLEDQPSFYAEGEFGWEDGFRLPEELPSYTEDEGGLPSSFYGGDEDYEGWRRREERPPPLGERIEKPGGPDSVTEAITLKGMGLRVFNLVKTGVTSAAPTFATELTTVLKKSIKTFFGAVTLDIEQKKRPMIVTVVNFGHEKVKFDDIDFYKGRIHKSPPNGALELGFGEQMTFTMCEKAGWFRGLSAEMDLHSASMNFQIAFRNPYAGEFRAKTIASPSPIKRWKAWWDMDDMSPQREHFITTSWDVSVKPAVYVVQIHNLGKADTCSHAHKHMAPAGEPLQSPPLTSFADAKRACKLTSRCKSIVRSATGEFSLMRGQRLEVKRGVTTWQCKYFYKGTKGGRCPVDDRIQDPHDCREAHAELGLPVSENGKWRGNYGEVPTGCSTRNAADGWHLHFNSHQFGKGRGDLIPLCYQSNAAPGVLDFA